MHSKKRGKSKSRKPAPEDIKVPENAPSRERIEEIVIGYAKQGMNQTLIGEKLKREHNVPYVKHMMGRRLGKILEEKGVASQLPVDLLNLMKRAVKMHAHIEKNKQDIHNTIRLRRVESKIWRLTKYYIRKGALPADWRYDPQKAELLIKGTA